MNSDEGEDIIVEENEDTQEIESEDGELITSIKDDGSS
jgi:hypothetical protein